MGNRHGKRVKSQFFLLFFNRLWDSESTIPGDRWFREIVGGILKKPAGFLAKNVRETKI